MEGLDIDAAAQLLRLLRWCHGRRVTVYAYGVPTDTRKGLRWPERVGERGQAEIHLNGTCISSSPRDRVRAKSNPLRRHWGLLYAKLLEHGRLVSLWRSRTAGRDQW